MKAMVGLVIAILIIFTVTLFWPTTSTNNTTISSSEKTTLGSEPQKSLEEESDQSRPIQLNTPADDAKSEQMAAEYKLLEKARTDLKRQLARIKNEMWGLKFPPDEAKEINEIMLNAHKLIKNPYMLGAFSDVEGIKDELDKVVFANKALEDIKSMIEQQGKSNNG